MKHIMHLSAMAIALLAGSAGAQADVYPAVYSGSQLTFGSYSNSGSLVLNANPTPLVFNPITLTPPANSLPGGSATSSVSGSLYYSGNGAYGNFNESDSSSSGANVSVALTRKGYGYESESEARAGHARLDLATQVGGPGSTYGSSSASGSASWTEWFVINGGSGIGTASFDSLLSSNFGSVAGGSATYSVNIAYSTGNTCWWWYSSCTPADYDQTLASLTGSLSGRSATQATQTIGGEFEFAYDKPFMLTATLYANVANGARAELSLDALGQSLSLPVGARISNLSGVFAQPVPEAETYAMMLAGLGLVGFMVSRRRKLV